MAALQDRLNDIGWEMFRHSSDDIDMFTEVIVGYIGKLMDDTVEKNYHLYISESKGMIGQKHPRDQLLH